MSPDLTTPPPAAHAVTAETLLQEAAETLASGSAHAAAAAGTKAAMAQAYATLALAQDTREAAYNSRTVALVTYLATLQAGTHADAQHAAVVDKLIQDRLNFTTTGEATP